MLLICTLSFDHVCAPVVPYGALVAGFNNLFYCFETTDRCPPGRIVRWFCQRYPHVDWTSCRGQLGPHRLPLRLKVNSHAQSPVVALLHTRNVIDQVCCDEAPWRVAISSLKASLHMMCDLPPTACAARHPARACACGAARARGGEARYAKNIS